MKLMKIGRIGSAITVALIAASAPAAAGTILGGASVTNGARGVIDGQIKVHFNDGPVKLHLKVRNREQADFMAANINLPAVTDDGIVSGIDWHTHPGPTFGIVTGGGTLTIIDDDCVEHVYQSGQAFVAPENPHTARNYSNADVTVRATFVMRHTHPATMPTMFVSADADDVLDAYCGLAE